jgi:hypothetical protein
VVLLGRLMMAGLLMFAGYRQVRDDTTTASVNCMNSRVICCQGMHTVSKQGSWLASCLPAAQPMVAGAAC